MPADTGNPIETLRFAVPESWADRNGHMNEGRYGQVFSDAADALLDLAGAGEAYIAEGFSFFTVEATTRFLHETRCGETVLAVTRIAEAGEKKLRLFHEMRRAGDGALLATCDQLLLHVDLARRKSCPAHARIRKRLAALAG
jgi:carnitine 3-dehydrogenase